MRSADGADVADPGFVRPPLVYFIAITAGLVIDRYCSVDQPFGVLGPPLGVLALIAAVALILLSQHAFRAANTPNPGNRSSESVGQSRPFSVSRNPIYLAFSLIGTGFALWSQSMWGIVTLIPAIFTMQLVVIPREERYLEKKFGLEYSAYKPAAQPFFELSVETR